VTCGYVKVSEFVIDDMLRDALFVEAGCQRQDCALILAATVKAIENHHMKVVSTGNPLNQEVQM